MLAELKKQQWGTWQVIGTEIASIKGHLAALCRCTVTGKETFVLIENLKTGKSRGPREARSVLLQSRKVLGERYDAIYQRCTNPNSPSFRNYGGRGIKVLFATRQDFIDYVLKELPHADYRGVQIDRIDNDGHYEPGNLQLSTSRENLMHTQRNKIGIDYRGAEVLPGHLWHLLKMDDQNFPYGSAWTAKLAAQGMSARWIIRLAYRYGLRGTRSKKFEEPNPEIVALYR